MIMRLLLLVFLITQLVLGYDHSIDLKRCTSETMCFIRQSCIEGQSDGSKLELYKGDAIKSEYIGTCNAIIQIKRLSDKKLHVMMQVSGNLKNEEGLKLDQGGDVFHCKSGDKPTGNQDLNLTYLGTQKFGDTLIFCSFTAELTKGDFSTFKKRTDSTNVFPKLLYVNADNSPGEIEYRQGNEALWEDAQLKVGCEHDLIRSSNKDGDEGILLTEVDTTLSKLAKCKTGTFVVHKPEVLTTEDVTCDRRDWKANIGGTRTKLTAPFEVFCSEKICRKCDAAPPPLTCTNCKSSTFDAPKNGDDCPALSCPNNKWTVTGSRIVEGEATCNRSSADPTKFAWFVQGTELSVAACMEKIDCGARFHDAPRYPIVPDSCPDGPACKIVGLGTNKLACKDGYSLKLTPGGTAPIKDVECNTATGLFAGAAAVECIPNDEANQVCLEWAVKA